MWPALIGAGASLLGGIFNRQSASDIAQQNIMMQQQFAQKGLTWRAEDATRAQDKTGINRLALLGAPSASFSNIVGDSSLGAGIADAGQSLGRAVAAATDQPSRADQLNEKLLEARIANVQADTVRMQALAAEAVTKLSQPGTPPAIPLPRPDMRRVGREYWAKPMFQDFVGPHGGVVVAPTQDFSAATQTLAATPSAAAATPALIGENLVQGTRELWPGFGMRGDTFRAIDNSQYVPF